MGCILCTAECHPPLYESKVFRNAALRILFVVVSDEFRTFAMRLSTSFPPKFTFPRCPEEFLFYFTKMLKAYCFDNQLFVFFKFISWLSIIKTFSLQ